MLLFVLQMVISIGAVIAFASWGISTPTALALTGLQYEAEGTSGLSVHTVVVAFCPGESITVGIGPEGASWVTVASRRAPLGPSNQAVMGYPRRVQVRSEMFVKTE